MTANTLRQFRDASPFVPFALNTQDGQVYHVDHPDYFSVSPNGQIAVVFLKRGGHATIDAALITEVTPENAVQPTSTPGAGA